jgi:hypothetical protein
MTSPFESPATSTEGVKPAELNGHLLIIKPVEYKTGIQTSLGEAEAIAVDLIDVTTGEEYTNVLFFNVALRNSLKPNIGKTVLATMGQGIAKPGKSAPWILNPVTAQADIDKATAILVAKTASGIVAPAPATPVASTAPELTPEVQALLAQLGAKPTA